MKKILKSILVLMMSMVLVVPVCAEENTGSDTTIPVQGVYQAKTGGEEKISVDIVWGNMSFTYHAGSKGTWNPTTHQYDGTEEAGWSLDKAPITLSNHSNVAIKASFNFTQESGVTTTGTFYSKNEEVYTAIATDKQYVNLANAETATSESETKGTIYFGVSGDSIAETKKLGTITVNVKKMNEDEDATEISSLAELNTLISSGGKGKLTQDITTTSGFTINKDLDLNLNGHTMTIGGRGIEVNEGITISLKNGTIDNPNGTAMQNSGNTTLTNCTLKTGYGSAIYNYSNMTLDGCTIVGWLTNESDERSNLYGNIISRNCTFDGQSIVVMGVSSATFDFDPTSFLHEGYNKGTVKDNGDGTWTVSTMQE